MNLWAAAEGYAQKTRIRRQERKEIIEYRLRDEASAKAIPPPRSTDPLETNTKPYLNLGDSEGWVAASETHYVYLRWSKHYPMPTSTTNKLMLEKLVTEAALLMGQHEVELRGQLRTGENEGTTIHPNIIYYDRHLTVYFRELNRLAHVYIGPHGEMDPRLIRLGRRGGLPTVVLC